VIEDLVRHYGYVAVLIGTLLEGETVVIVAGFAAHRGYLRLPLVMAFAFTGSFATDQVLFHLGRRYGRRILERRTAWHARVVRVHRLFESRPTAFMFGFRFLYGLRIVSPILLGTSAVSGTKFLVVNAAGAAIWAAAFSGAGYVFGATLEAMLGRIERYERIVFIGILVAGAVLWAIHRFLLRSRNARS